MTGLAPGEDFSACDATALAVYRSLASAIAPLAGVRVVVSKSQVASRARRGFAEVAHPAPSTWLHHVELRGPDDVDVGLIAWVTRAHAEAGESRD